VFEGKVVKVNFDIPLKCIRNGNRAVFIEVSKSNWVSVTDLAEGPPSPPYFGLKKKKKKWGVLRNLGMPPLGCGGSNRFSVVGLAEPIPPLFWVKKNGSFCGILECLHWIVVGVILNVWKTNTNTNCLHPS